MNSGQQKATGVPGFEIIKTESFDGDNGLAQFLSKSAGESSSIGSGKIALKNAGNPKLTYSYRAVPGKDVQFSVKVRINGGEKKELAGFNFKDLTGDIGWRTEVVDLNELKDSKYIMLYFEAVDNTGSTRVCVDNITILDVLTDNLAIELKTAGNITAGTEITCPVNVKNIGVNDAEEYTINLYANNELVDIKAGESIRFGELKTFDMAYKSKVNDPNELELKVMLEYSKDKDISDNTAVTSVRLIQPDMPGITGLEGTFNEDEQSVNLTWNTPDFEKERATDDFEDLEAFSISDFGKWKVDGNWKYQTMYPEGITWPNAGEPAPFIVFNPSLADFSAYPIFTEFTIPHSGEQFLASISTGAFEGNNAWLISPSLSGKAQTVSFWAKSISGWYGYEKFEIRYSTTGRDIADFDKVAFNEEKLPEEWTEYNVDLPAEARYFAVYVKSENTFMFMIDDITYQPGYGKLLGYNIYRDGKHTGTVTANTTTYTDKAVPNGSHAYNVTAVYTIGESSFSDTYNLYGTSITGIHGDGETYAYGSKASIVVCNAENMEIKVYTTDGKLLSKTYGERKSVIPAIRAQYVVRVGEKTFNVIVE